MSARTIDGKPLTPGLNVDKVNVESGLAMAERQGYLANGNDYLIVEYALMRHRRGEEDGAEKTWLGHFGPQSFTGWRMVLAAAISAPPAVVATPLEATS